MLQDVFEEVKLAHFLQFHMITKHFLNERTSRGSSVTLKFSQQEYHPQTHPLQSHYVDEIYKT